jgi:hypothetical protein
MIIRMLHLSTNYAYHPFKKEEQNNNRKSAFVNLLFLTAEKLRWMARGVL